MGLFLVFRGIRFDRESMPGPVLVRIVGLGVDGRSGRMRSSIVGVPTKGEAGFDAGEDPGSESFPWRDIPGQYKSSSNISNAPPGFITRVISSNNMSHCVANIEYVVDRWFILFARSLCPLEHREQYALYVFWRTCQSTCYL